MSLVDIIKFMDKVTWMNRLTKINMPYQRIHDAVHVALPSVQLRGALAYTNLIQSHLKTFAITDWGNTRMITRFAGRPGAGLTAYHQWQQQQYYTQLNQFVSMNQITKRLTLSGIATFHERMEHLVNATPDPPWLIHQLFQWGRNLANALQLVAQEAQRQGLSLAVTIKLMLAQARTHLRRQRRQLEKILGICHPLAPRPSENTGVVRPTYGRLTSIQSCAPPLA